MKIKVKGNKKEINNTEKKEKKNEKKQCILKVKTYT